MDRFVAFTNAACYSIEEFYERTLEHFEDGSFDYFSTIGGYIIVFDPPTDIEREDAIKFLKDVFGIDV